MQWIQIQSVCFFTWTLKRIDNYHCKLGCPTNLKVDEKLKLSGDRTFDLRVSSTLLYHWGTSHIVTVCTSEIGSLLIPSQHIIMYVLQVLWVYSTHCYQKSTISSTQDRNFLNIGQWDPEDSAGVRMSFIMGGVSPTGLVIVNSNPTIWLIKNN